MTAARPWMKFYPRDWRGDQALRAVSLAARGLWMDCLCLMHEAEPRGHLLLNGKKVEVDALARMVGASSEEVSALLAELLSAGVFTLARNGVVTSRRMIRDEKAAKEGSKAVRKRWEQAADEKAKIADPNRSVHSPPSHIPITQRPEARVQKERTPPQQQQPGGESEPATTGADPAGVEGSAKGGREAIEARLREAAGLAGRGGARIRGIEKIEALLAEGFDLERDVLPVIRAHPPTSERPIRSWAFYATICREERAATAAGRAGQGGEARLEDDLERARAAVRRVKGGDDEW